MIQDRRYFSHVYGQEREYQVILPDMDCTSQRYPVLYLLHGKEQNYLSWTRYTYLELFAKTKPYIMVIPNGDDVWYREFPSGYYRYVEYIKEVIGHIDAHYPTIPTTKQRGIAGISMGGYGAFLVGLKHPELVGSISALSGVLNITNHLFNEAHGLNYGLPAEKKLWDSLNLLVLARTASGLATQLLFDSGTEDEISYRDSEDFHGVLTELGIPHSFNRHSGGHEWSYWDEHLEEHLTFHLHSFLGGQNDKNR